MSLRIRVHGRETVDHPTIDRVLYLACLAGEYPAEALTSTDARDDLIREFVTKGWTDREIADHTRWTVYTVARIRDRIHLLPNGVKIAQGYIWGRRSVVTRRAAA